MEITRNPLCWPHHVARTAPSKRGPALFAECSLAVEITFVRQEVNRLNGRAFWQEDPKLIISSNWQLNKDGSPKHDLQLNRDGSPKNSQTQPSDPGVAVYFTLLFSVNGKPFSRPCVLTCDKWTKVQWNLRAIGKDIEAQRGRARWGCGTVQQAFQGYLAIPERRGSRAWWEVLKCSPDARPRELKQARDTLALTAHPDKGGTHELWIEIQNAFEQGMASYR